MMKHVYSEKTEDKRKSFYKKTMVILN